MGTRILTLLAILIAMASSITDAAEKRVSGRVVDADGIPVSHASVSPFWRANGSPRRLDGTDYDLTDDEQNAEFWGNLGDMQPWQSPVVTAADGTFEITLPGRKLHLLAMDSTRALGGIIELADQPTIDNAEISLAPLVTVRGKMRSSTPGKKLDWSHVYVELAPRANHPLASRRVVSCGSYEGRFEFRLPPGRYRLDAYGNSDRHCELLDLRAGSPCILNVGVSRRAMDFGSIELDDARPGRDVLEKSARQAGRWRDYTKHYGQAAPPWHAVDARGISLSSKISDFKGKWLMIYFWGFGCASCLQDGIPRLIEFYEAHADQRDRFEIIGVCIDIHDEIEDLEAMDAALDPIITHVWQGKKIEYPIVLDNPFQTWERYGIPGLGTLVLVDPRGNLIEGDEATLERMLNLPSE